ncbi:MULTISPECIES: hypothetical protein [unclassified Microcoleus]|uniref:hypothetical protein n=1 Tax=unclassified Microcoleus TaxID=2642155 RepID=UPI002FD16F07
MKITKIGYGYAKNEGNYENSKIYLEAEIEGWEDASQSLNILRSQVAEELKLPERLHDLRNKVDYQERTLRNLSIQVLKEKENLERAQRAWENFSEFLTAHGVNPETLTIEDFSAMRQLHTGTPGQKNTIVYPSKDTANDSDDSDESGFYYEPYSNSNDSDNHEDREENPDCDRIPF